MRRFVLKGFMLMLVGSLAACSQCTDSVTAHTKSYVFKSKSDFDPNYTTQISGTIQLMKPVFKAYHDDGIKDRQAGISREVALQKVDNFKKEKASEKMESQHTFINSSYASTLSDKQRALFINEAMGAYLDGFDGR
ncbi:Exc2 family lipoprotein [Erwinia sp. JUb26]|uniref:Exc2 family lipoprotein n=1 Tax=Erwinia sp. JUb26 TaxID=2485126 RepID=UPI000F475DB1|nr:Exc2 family lipoprotein [Erwinia sp. JUb26]ROR10001.1 hypothetical protein EC836_104254 [Erwinia sp. JUb26]